jgi:hypothetical protein
MTKQHLSLRAAVAALEDLASDEDEIFFDGDETTPNDLLDTLREQGNHASRQAEDLAEISTEGVTIGFSKLDGTYVAEGTFADMVADRLAGS